MNYTICAKYSEVEKYVNLFLSGCKTLSLAKVSEILHNYGDATIAKLTGFSLFIKAANAI